MMKSQIPLYMWYETAHTMVAPARAFAQASRWMLNNPNNLFGKSSMGRTLSAACELFERSTRRYGKPEFAFGSIMVDGVAVPTPGAQFLAEAHQRRNCHGDRACCVSKNILQRDPFRPDDRP